jgi:endoglucanase
MRLFRKIRVDAPLRAALILFSALNMARAELQYFGANLASAEFGVKVPGTLGADYTYPTSDEVDYYMSKGMNTFRVPFLWERMQLNLNGSLSGTELTALDTFVDYATAHGANVILDPHDYGAYYGDPNGVEDSPVTTANFQNFWAQLATYYKDNDRVIFGLMNEPPGPYDETRLGVDTQTWLGIANAAIAAIRETGAMNLILVPGNGYDGAWRWNLDGYGGKNSDIMGEVVDSANNFAYEVHQYLDLAPDPLLGPNFSGTYTNVNGLPVALQGLTDFAQWLRDHDARGFLGEFGVAPGAEKLAALDAVLSNIDANADVWEGWTAWAGGPWWGDYPFSIEPDGNVDKPQIAILQDHIPVPEPSTTTLLFLAAILGIALSFKFQFQKSKT